MTYFKTPNLLTAAAAFAAISFAPSAFAQQECGDQTCEEGYECASFQGLCPEIDCAGEDCPVCEEEEFFYCERAACESDDECGDYMICATMEEYDCSNVKDVDCAPDEPCEEPVGECEVLEVQRCAAPWELPCEADADCGEGHTCELIQCVCDGAAAGGSSDEAPPPDGSEDPATSELVREDCGCVEADTGWCQLSETACEEDADCPDSWTCQDNPEGACWADSEGNTGCEPADPERICMPPGYSVGILEVAAADSAATSSAASSGLADDGAVDETVEDGETADLPLSDPDDVDVSAQSGAADEDDVAELGSDDDDSGAKSSSGGGCTVATTPGAGSADLMAMLAALGAALTMRRRRDRRS